MNAPLPLPRKPRSKTSSPLPEADVPEADDFVFPPGSTEVSTPVQLTQEDLLRLMYDDPAPTPGSGPTPGTPDLTKPAFGQAMQHSALPIEERENASFNWTRNNYHSFVEHIEQVEHAQTEGLEAGLAATALRDYTLKQIIGLSGHPDPRIAVKALDMLAKTKFVSLYDERRTKSPEEMSPTELDESIRRLLGPQS